MKNKSTAELRQEYEIYKILLDLHQAHGKGGMSPKEWEEYLNAALDGMLDIRKELERRGEKI